MGGQAIVQTAFLGITLNSSETCVTDYFTIKYLLYSLGQDEFSALEPHL